AIEQLYHNQQLLNALQSELNSILDIERISSKIAMDKANAKDLVALGSSLYSSTIVYEMLTKFKDISPNWNLGKELIIRINNTRELISGSICDDPPILLSEGKMIRKGYNNQLDKLHELKSNSQDYLSEYLEAEKSNSGITNLKIKYNRIIGHFLEVTKSNIQLVPEYFIKRQSLVNNDRYTTEKLSELESDLNSASEKIITLEKSLFIDVRDIIKKDIDAFLTVSAYISDIDCISSFTQAATEYGYVRPVVMDSSELVIIEGRHPVVEYNLNPGDFIPNPTSLNAASESFALITGPNMAGKSTSLRQVGLIVLMAQSGSFVPASSAKIGITDRIFCRVGASDNLARGESTFLVEMNETAFILRNATEKSLVIMDEVGRGTSTEDGLAIAWSVSEFLLNSSIKTLFATHYHELTRLQNERLINLHLEVKENEGEIIFLKKVTKGSSGSSYGIHVAKLAGIPQSVLVRAASILAGINTLKTESIDPSSMKPELTQQSLFSQTDLITNSIKSLDLNSMTPLDALNYLYDLRSEIEAGE
ncbi:MAG: DNA mismatch repair protein MutS, partial [Spirochaetales bacterium]|nr:DNA mismatch repair protein MutS [Spirochaetales bacterium]